MYRSRRNVSSIRVEGIKIVLLAESCTRETVRFWRDGHLIAVLQKNGNVAVSGSGIFDSMTSNVRSMAKVARCLHGLKLLSSEMLQTYLKARDDAERHSDISQLGYNAERLGFKIVPLKKKK